MSRLFQPFPGKPAFGTLEKNTYASDYTKKLKLRNSIFNSITSTKINNLSQQQFIDLKNCELKYNILFNKSYLDKTNLIAGQYSKENLEGVITVSSSNDTEEPYTETNIVTSNTVPFYFNYNIDPTGALFGNTQCGLNKFTNFMQITVPITKLQKCVPLNNNNAVICKIPK